MRAALTASAPTTQLLLVAGRNPEQKKKKKKKEGKKKLFPMHATRRSRERKKPKETTANPNAIPRNPEENQKRGGDKRRNYEDQTSVP
jgi:hypothetical protein